MARTRSPSTNATDSERDPAAPRTSVPSRGAVAKGLVRTARPRQWAKNVLVFAAPLAAGVLGEPAQFGRTMVAFVAFCFAASGTYFLNDALDADADRLHPTKRNRPVANGTISDRLAKVMAVVLIIMGIGIAAPLNSGALAAVVGGYVVLTCSYSLWLKHEAVIDLAAVAAGFVLRAIAGGVATGVPISDWFLIVAGAGSLFMVTGKRTAEQVEMGTDGHGHRVTLGVYSASFLNYVRSVSSAVMITAYCLWAFENAAKVGDTFWFRLSIVPFVLAVFRYALVAEQGKGSAPEEIVLSDRVLQVLGLLWVAIFAVGVHV